MTRNARPRLRPRLSPDSPGVCLWSAFPDMPYQDSGARFPNHCAELHRRLASVWKNTIQAIPSGRKALVTSDHGYIVFGHGFSARRENAAIRPLPDWFGGEWSRALTADKDPPSHPDLALLSDRRLTMIRGRVQTHPPGPAGARRYKHGGLSLMEMLTPWIVRQPEGA